MTLKSFNPYIAIVGIPLLIVLVVVLTSNRGTRFFKNVKSNLSSLERDVLVVNSFTGDTLFKFSGPCYFNTDRNGNVYLIYEKDGRSRKADWMGSGFVFQANER